MVVKIRTYPVKKCCWRFSILFLSIFKVQLKEKRNLNQRFFFHFDIRSFYLNCLIDLPCKCHTKGNSIQLENVLWKTESKKWMLMKKILFFFFEIIQMTWMILTEKKERLTGYRNITRCWHRKWSNQAQYTNHNSTSFPITVTKGWSYHDFDVSRFVCLMLLEIRLNHQ